MLQKHLIKLYPGLLSAIVVLAILWLTLAPHPIPENDIPMFPHMDKLVHALMFGGLVLALVIDRELFMQRRYIATGHMPRRTLLPLVTFFVVATFFGGAIEMLQKVMGLGRGADWLDFGADAIGALVFVIVSPRIVKLLLYR